MAEISQALHTMVESIVDASIVLLGAGTLSMVLVEFAKAVLRWRMRFHRYAIERWLAGAPLSPERRPAGARLRSFLVEEWSILRGAPAAGAPTRGPGDEGQRFPARARTKEQLLYLVAGGAGDAEAWYDQDADTLFPQLESAVQLAIDFPRRYEHLYEFLVGGLTDEDQDDARRWSEGLSERLFQRAPEDTPPDAHDDPLAVRTRLGNLASRRVEILRQWAVWRSARSKQFLAFGIGLALTSSTLLLSGVAWHHGVLLGIAAGMVAPFAKDLTDRMSQVPLRR